MVCGQGSQPGKACSQVEHAANWGTYPPPAGLAEAPRCQGAHPQGTAWGPRESAMPPGDSPQPVPLLSSLQHDSLLPVLVAEQA